MEERRFATVDADGWVTGFYDNEIHASRPDGAVEIAPEVYAEWVANTATRRWDGAALVVVEAEPPPPTPAIRSIRPLAFRRRLGPATQAAITLAAYTSLQAGQPGLQVFMDNLGAGTFVDLDHAETVAGVNALRSMDLITAAEGAALLADGTPAEAE